MSGPLRVFLIAAEPEELRQLRVRTDTHAGLEIVGTALVQDGQLESAMPQQGIDAVVVSPAAWARSAPSFRRKPREDRLIEELTARERDVLALVADGRANRDIAARLTISEHTVKFHLASLFGKLGVSTRAQAVRRALEWGVIEI